MANIKTTFIADPYGPNSELPKKGPPEKLYHLPVPHVYFDGSVGELFVYQYETDKANGSPIINRGDGYDDMIVTASPDHPRQLARALMIAADLSEKENKRLKKD